MFHLRDKPPGAFRETGQGRRYGIGPRRSREEEEKAQKGRHACFQAAHEYSEQAK
ncbi:MAG: hypothetical protein ACX937_13995 [Roseicyclus sp.]